MLTRCCLSYDYTYVLYCCVVFATQLVFLQEHPGIWMDVLMFSITSASGQLFIFYTIAEFDSLVSTTVTTTRKFFTIIVSVLYHGNVLTSGQWVAVALVFTSIIWDVVASHSSKKQSKAATGAPETDKKAA